MGAATHIRETLGETLLASLLLHGLLLIFLVGYTSFGLRFRGRWGTSWGEGGAIRVSTVTSLPGVPLPTPMLATPNTLATENPGLYQQELPRTLEPPKEAEAIPKFKETAPPEKAVRVNRRIQKEVMPPRENAIPFGLGGKPSMSYSQFVNSAGEGGLKFGEGNFGERYAWYVNAVRSRISANWLLATISPGISTAPRVYIDFDILRDGTIANAEITHSSGFPEVDRSALRAVLASNPLGPLPPDYSDHKVSVEFYFDFHR